jgi:hypothetical protein
MTAATIDEPSAPQAHEGLHGHRLRPGKMVRAGWPRWSARSSSSIPRVAIKATSPATERRDPQHGTPAVIAAWPPPPTRNIRPGSKDIS